jgi:delta 1-pyrroline-5-carboxylate dehydrogenase
MLVIKEETFGPVLPVVSFKNEDEVITEANDTIFGLNASVWTKDLDRGERVARKLKVGNCAINDVIKNIGNPDLPFGGTRQSGFGKIHGPEGLRNFCVTKSIMVNDGKYEREINWFPYSSQLYDNLKKFMDFIYAGKKKVSWVLRNRKTIQFFRKYFK